MNDARPSHSSPIRPAAPLWLHEAGWTFLNHGSFGGCPRPVLDAQRALRDQLESQPVRFLDRELEGRLDGVRASLAPVLGADSQDLVFVANATTAVNTVLRSLPLGPGDEILLTNHGYPACRNAAEVIAARRGARVVIARLPFPLTDSGEVTDAIVAATSSKTRVALIDHITSPTALVLPIAEIVEALAARGIDTLVDAAHAPGQVPMDLDGVGAAWTTGNAHKWLCAPKGAAFLHVRRDRHGGLEPLVKSHGHSAPLRDRGRLRIEFDWTGTADPTALLTIPAALEFLEGLLPGGLPALMAHNHQATVAARAQIADALGQGLPCPADMLGAMASIELPEPREPLEPSTWHHVDPIGAALIARHRVEVPVMPNPADPSRRVVRVSMQFYNEQADVDRLIEALTDVIGLA